MTRVHVVLLAGFVLANLISAQNVTSPEAKGRLLSTTSTTKIANKSIETTTEGSEKSSITTTSPIVTTFELYNEQNLPCLRAQLHADFDISYEATTSAKQSASTTLSPDARASGFCGNDTSQLVLKWGVFTLWMTFTQHPDHNDVEAVEESLNTPMLGQPYWEATFIRLSYNVDAQSNSSIFKNILYRGVHSVISQKDESFFATPTREAFKCSTPQSVNLTSSGSYGDTVTMTVSNVQIQPFSLDSTKEWGTIFECDVDKKREERIRERNLVPIVVAGCLSGIIVLVVIAYVISKRTNKIPYSVIE